MQGTEAAEGGTHSPRYFNNGQRITDSPPPNAADGFVRVCDEKPESGGVAGIARAGFLLTPERWYLHHE